MNSPAAFHGGHEAVFYYASETAAYPSGNAVPNPALPAAVVHGGRVDVPDSTHDDGSKEIWSLGSIEAQTIIPGGVTHQMTVSSKLSNKALLQKCFLGNGGFRDLADLCLITGASDVRGDGSSDAMRFAKCASLSISAQKGSAQEITAQMQFQGLAVEPGAPLSPTSAELLAQPVPMSWHNLMEVNVAGVNIRDVISSITLTVQHQLVLQSFRPDYGPASPWSRTGYALIPVKTSYSASITCDTPAVARDVMGLLGSETFTGAFDMVCSTAGSSVAGSAPFGMNFNAGAGRIKNRKRNGGSQETPLSGQVELALIGLGLS